MDLHDNLAFSTAVSAPQQENNRKLSDRDREALHRMFDDMRRAIAGTSQCRVAALPHP